MDPDPDLDDTMDPEVTSVMSFLRSTRTLSRGDAVAFHPWKEEETGIVIPIRGRLRDRGLGLRFPIPGSGAGAGRLASESEGRGRRATGAGLNRNTIPDPGTTTRRRRRRIRGGLITRNAPRFSTGDHHRHRKGKGKEKEKEKEKGKDLVFTKGNQGKTSTTDPGSPEVKAGGGRADRGMSGMTVAKVTEQIPGIGVGVL